MARPPWQWLRRQPWTLVPKEARSVHSTVYARPWLLGVLLSLWVAAFLSPHFSRGGRYYEVGEYTSKAIKAPRAFRVVDEAATLAAQDHAEAAVVPVYDYDPAVARGAVAGIADGFRRMRDFYAGYDARDATPSGARAEVTLSAIPKDLERDKLREFAASLGADLKDEDLALLARRRFAAAIETVAWTPVAEFMAGTVVADRDLFLGSLPPGAERAFVERDLESQKERTVTDLATVRDLPRLRAEVPAAIERALDAGDARLAPVLTRIVLAAVHPNLFFNGKETADRKRKARETVPPVARNFEKGQLILGEGMEVTPETRQILDALYAAQVRGQPFLDYLGTALFAFLLLAAAYEFASRNVRKFRVENKDVLFLFVMIGLSVTLTWGAQATAQAIGERFETIPSSALEYAIPVAAAAMMTRFILNSEVALVFVAISGVLLGMLFERSLAMTAFCLIGGLAGAHWVGQTGQRYGLLKAGFKLGLVQAVAVAATGLIGARHDSLDAGTLLAQFAGALAGGNLAGLVVLAAAPLVEVVFAYTTDVKLMELANMNHPLLKEMVIRAPGTYNHSILVSTLAETAAEAIHANPILAKVGGLYQDIGKIGKPHYFIENQREGENPHDRLAPRMSGLVLLSHVKEGVDLARRHKLGDRVVDIIQQHHGKGLIKYFYHRAKEQEDPTMESVSEEDFRYPGPKPQTREAAIVMLADVVEASSRLLKDPSPSRIADLVEECIDNAFKEGQLDECDVTLRDLFAIGQAFQKVLNGLFHARIEYPDAGAEGERRKSDPGPGAKQPKDAPSAGGKDPRAGKDDTRVVKIH